MSEGLPSEPFSASTSFAGLLLNGTEEDNLQAIQYARLNKSKKIRTATPLKPRLLFDLLPPEILHAILQLLPHDDLITLTEVDDRCFEVARNDQVLKFHFKERSHLIKAAGYRKAAFDAVLKNHHLASYLNATIKFVRHLPELRSSAQKTVSKSVFYFGQPSRYAKLSYLLQFAQRRFSFFRNHVFVVVAESADEGRWFADNLACASYEATYFSAQNSTAAFDEISKTRRKLFFIVSKLTHLFRRPSMEAIINFQPLPTETDDYFELHVLDPRELHSYVDITNQSQLVIASKHVNFLEFCGRKPLLYSRPLTLRRSFYVQRNLAPLNPNDQLQQHVNANGNDDFE